MTAEAPEKAVKAPRTSVTVTCGCGARVVLTSGEGIHATTDEAERLYQLHRCASGEALDAVRRLLDQHEAVPV